MKFKEGDRVRLVKGGGYDVPAGLLGVVDLVSPAGPVWDYMVMLDCLSANFGRLWFVKEAELELSDAPLVARYWNLSGPSADRAANSRPRLLRGLLARRSARR